MADRGQPRPAPGVAPSLIDLCAPPAGHRFAAGLWTTHDLDLAALSDAAAPALLELTSQDRDRRRRSVQAHAWEDGPLAVLHPGSRAVTAGPPLPPWIVTIPVPPPLLHAKLLLLLFSTPSERAVVTRAVVTSANLTHSGLRRNREVHVWEDNRPLPRLALAADLVHVLRNLLDDAATSASTAEATQRIGWATTLLDWIVAEGVTRSSERGALAHSIDQRRNLANALPSGRASRVVIVSPAFAPDASHHPVAHLGDRIGPGTEVDYYAPLATRHDEARPVMATAIRKAFEDSECELRVWGVPELVDHQADEDPLSQRERRLHAKLIAVVDDDLDGNRMAHVLAGSANFTHSGIGGRNREAMARMTITEDALDEFLTELKASVHERQHPTEQTDDEPGGVPGWLQATFTPSVDQGWDEMVWSGELILDWDRRPTRITYGGRPVRISAAQGFVLHRHRGTLSVTYGTAPALDVAIQLADLVHLGAAPSEDEMPPAAELLALLRFGRQRRAVRQTTGQGPTSPTTPDERIDYPLHEPLSILVRHRNQLRSRWTASLEDNVRAALQAGATATDGGSMVTCGLAIAGAYRPDGASSPSDKLLRALVTALRDEDDRR